MVADIPLKEFAFFKDFSDDQLKKLASLAKEETHPTGAHLYQGGDTVRSLYLIKEGADYLIGERGMSTLTEY